MAAAPYNKDVASRVSSDVADIISRDFYRAMSFKAQRSYIATYFLAEHDIGGGHKLPDIIFNGTKYNSPGLFQEFVEALPKLNYKVESLAAAIINPALAIDGFNQQDIKKGRAAVVSVTVSGHITSDDDDTRTFSDNFIMMPNPEANTIGRRDRGKREWLISVYNSRLVG